MTDLDNRDIIYIGNSDVRAAELVEDRKRDDRIANLSAQILSSSYAPNVEESKALFAQWFHEKTLNVNGAQVAEDELWKTINLSHIEASSLNTRQVGRILKDVYRRFEGAEQGSAEEHILLKGISQMSSENRNLFDTYIHESLLMLQPFVNEIDILKFDIHSRKDQLESKLPSNVIQLAERSKIITFKSR